MRKVKLVFVIIVVVVTILFATCSLAFEDEIANVILLASEKNDNVVSDESIILEDNNEEFEDIRIGSVKNNVLINSISTRSDVINRFNKNYLYVQVDDVKDNIVIDNNEDYEDIVVSNTVKIADVKISFDMDVSKTTGLSKEDFITLVSKMKYDRTGILKKNAGWIWECCQKYSVNEIFVLGICGIESGWCSASQHQRTHNYSSLMKGGKLIAYANDEQGFEAMIKLLGQKYLSPKGSLYHGATITGVGRSYCNPTTWPKKVYACMKKVLI